MEAGADPTWSEPKLDAGFRTSEARPQKNGDSAILLKLKIKSDHYNWSQGLNSAPGKSYL